MEEAPRLMAEAALEAVGRLLERGRVALGEGHLEEALALARQGSYLGGALDLGEAARALALWGTPSAWGTSRASSLGASIVLPDGVKENPRGGPLPSPGGGLLAPRGAPAGDLP